MHVKGEGGECGRGRRYVCGRVGVCVCERMVIDLVRAFAGMYVKGEGWKRCVCIRNKCIY